MAQERNAENGGLVGYLDGLVDALRELAPLAIQEGDIRAIHQSRVATRRLKAALDLFEPVLSGNRKGPARLLKRLRRRLGPLRDADVMIGHLEHLGTTQRWASAAGWVADRLRQRREVAFADLRKKVDAQSLLDKLDGWKAVRDEMQEAAGEPTEMLLRDSLLEQLHQFEQAADRLFGKQANAVAAGERQDPHELRIAGKALRYTLEMAREDGHPLPKGVLKQFKALQEALGLWHDHVVLGQEALRADLEADLPLHDSALHRAVLALATEAARRAEGQLKQFGKLWRAQGAEIREVIEGLFAAPPAASSEVPIANAEAIDGSEADGEKAAKADGGANE